MLPMLAALGSSILSGATNLFAKSENEKKQEEAKKKALELLNRNRLSEEQINTRVNQVGNAYNTQTMEVLNNQAYGIGNLLNQDLARTLTATKLASQKAMAEVQTRENLYGINNQINSQIAQIEGTPIQGITTGEIIGGAINTGLQAYSMFKGIENQDKYIDAMKEMNGSTDNFDFQMPAMGSDGLVNFTNDVAKPNIDISNIGNSFNMPNSLQNISNKVGDFSKGSYTSSMFEIPNSEIVNIEKPNTPIRTNEGYELKESAKNINIPDNLSGDSNKPYFSMFSQPLGYLLNNQQNLVNLQDINENPKSVNNRQSQNISWQQALQELPTKKFQSPIPILGYGEDLKQNNLGNNKNIQNTIYTSNLPEVTVQPQNRQNKNNFINNVAPYDNLGMFEKSNYAKKFGLSYKGKDGFLTYDENKLRTAYENWLNRGK